MNKSTLRFGFGLVVVVFLALAIKIWVVEIMRVPSDSMLPNLFPGDYILVNKLAYWKKSPRQGEVVVFFHPSDDTQLLIKRVVGIAKDEGFLNQKELRINGQQVTQGTLPKESISSNLVDKDRWEFLVEKLDGKTYIVQYERWEWAPPYNFGVMEGEIALLGDNRHYSQDSRAFGMVNLNRVVGKAVTILCSVEPFTKKIRVDRVGKKIE